MTRTIGFILIICAPFSALSHFLQDLHDGFNALLFNHVSERLKDRID